MSDAGLMWLGLKERRSAGLRMLLIFAAEPGVGEEDEHRMA